VLAREYQPALTRFFRKRARQPADVEDLVQEVLCRLAVRGGGQRIEHPEAYLMRTATNVWRDYLRKMRTHAQDLHDEYQEDWHAREDHGPVDVIEGERSVEAVLNVLLELPERTRQVFLLCRVEGMRQKSVALRLGVSISSVEKHMIKAIAYLARRLEEVRSSEESR
jgi:RNA polymerase sigma-70 factor (ECF subfamily)